MRSDAQLKLLQSSSSRVGADSWKLGYHLMINEIDGVKIGIFSDIYIYNYKYILISNHIYISLITYMIIYIYIINTISYITLT